MTSETVNSSVAEGSSVRSPAKVDRVDPSGWLTATRFSGLLVLLIFVSFPDLIFGAKTFLFRDYSLFGYPLAHYHREAFWRGEIPLWNPLNNCGIPFMAQWNTMIFYPLSLIYLLLPLPWAVGWFCLVHLFLAGLGMHHLAYRWTENRLAASIAGIAFAFSGLTLSFLIWPNDIAAMGWLPWVWLLVERGWNRGGSALFKAVFVGAIQMLSGGPEVILFTWVLVAAVWLWQFLATKEARWRFLSRFLIIILLIGGISAVQLLPFVDLLQHSQRGTHATSTYWSMPPWGWANLLVPLFRSTETSMGVFLQPTQGWTSSYYLGIGVLVLAMVAALKVRLPFVWMLALALGLSLILALGDAGHLYGPVQTIFPLIGVMRFPVKLVIFAGSAAPLLAAFAIAHLQTLKGDAKRDFWRATALAASICLFLIVATIRFSSQFPGDGEQPHATLVNGMTRGAILVLVLALLFAGDRCLSSRWRTGMQVAVLLGVWFDLISHVPNQNPSVEAQAYQIGLPPLTDMNPRPKLGESRAMLSYASIQKFHTTIISNTFQAVLGVRLGLFDNCNLLEDIPKFDGFYSLFIPEAQEIRFRMFPSTNTIRPALADFVGASQISSEARFLEWEPRKTWMPMLSMGQRPEFAEPAETLEALCNPAFDPRKVVYLPLAAKSAVSVSNSIPAKILARDFSPHRIRADVEGTQSSLLVVAQTYYHSWKATIDGKPATLWRANYAFQAIQVPAGHHHVQLIYEDQGFRWGAIISGVTVLGCLGFVFPRKR